MELKDYLKQVAADLERPAEVGKIFNSVFYGNDFETNAQAADDAIYPMCQIVPPLSSGIDIHPLTTQNKDRWNVFIYFCDIQRNAGDVAGNMDQTAEQNDVIIQRMRTAAKLYINKLNRSRFFDPITKAEFKHITFKWDATTSGILAFFTLVERPGVIYC